MILNVAFRFLLFHIFVLHTYFRLNDKSPEENVKSETCRAHVYGIIKT